jgi:hypothetical protein
VDTWTDSEEAAFVQLMAAGKLERMAAIRLYRRCKDDLVKALQIAREIYGVSDAKTTAYETTRSARVAGLVKARAARHLNGPIQQRKSCSTAITKAQRG